MVEIRDVANARRDRAASSDSTFLELDRLIPVRPATAALTSVGTHPEGAMADGSSRKHHVPYLDEATSFVMARKGDVSDNHVRWFAQPHRMMGREDATTAKLQSRHQGALVAMSDRVDHAAALMQNEAALAFCLSQAGSSDSSSLGHAVLLADQRDAGGKALVAGSGAPEGKEQG